MPADVRPMNYRHAYHAGNFADVFKHATLIALLESFHAKTSPFCYLDTHAGRGGYELDGTEAAKTAEADAGIGRLLELPQLPASLRRYVDLVRSFNPDAESPAIRHYPGSPLLAARLLREHDRAVLCELQKEEAAALRRRFRDHDGIHVHQRDGYEALPGLVPPREKRGLVLIDPPFEAREEEFRHIEATLAPAWTRWPTGRYAIWYPIKLRQHVVPFRRWLKQHRPGSLLIAELLLHPDHSPLRLNGCGLAIVNPPWQFEQTLDEMLTVLARHLAPDGRGKKRIDLLAAETGMA